MSIFVKKDSIATNIMQAVKYLSTFATLKIKTLLYCEKEIYLFSILSHLSIISL